jgi:hypothetical protein
MAKEVSLSPLPGQSGQRTQPELTVNPEADKVRDVRDLSVPKVDLSEAAKATTSNEELVDLIISQTAENLLPWEKIRLPSQGLYYEGRLPDGWIEVRPFGLDVDKILATARLAQTGQSIEWVYKNCVRFPDATFNALDLLVGDRSFLLFYLRGITHGNNYEFQLTCNNEECQKQSLQTYDLNQLAENIKSPKVQKEPLRIHLPYLSEITKKDMWVEVRFMRGRDIEVILRKQKFTEKLKGAKVRSVRTGDIIGRNEINLDTTIEENLNLLILNVNGVSDKTKIQKIIAKFHSRDSSTIRETLQDAEPGIDLRIIVKCPDCNNEMKISLPVTESFFRPTNGGGVSG